MTAILIVGVVAACAVLGPYLRLAGGSATFELQLGPILFANVLWSIFALQV